MNDDIIFWGGKLLLEVISLKLLLYQKKIKNEVHLYKRTRF